MRQTVFGDLTIADAHVHFLAHSFFRALAAQGKTIPPEDPDAALESLLGWHPPREPEALAQRWVEELDRHGVGRAVLMASVHGDEASVAAAVGRFPKRFYGYFMVNPVATDALSRVQRGLGQGLLQGICLFPAMHRYSVADDVVRPILDLAASQPGVLVFVHCGALSVGIRRRLGLASSFDLRYSNPIDLHPVALRYPSLPFVMPHFGSGMFREGLMVADLCPNVYFDTSSSNSWVRYQSPPLTLEAVFDQALAVVGPDRLLFGSDSGIFPQGWKQQVFDNQVAVLRKLGITSSQAAQIFGGNLDRLLRRNPAP